MNKLDTTKRAQILHHLAEGCSMRATSRLTGAAKKTVERLLESAGAGCLAYHDKHVRNLQSKVVQLDEIWSFVGSKQANTGIIYKDKGERGDIWTWVAMDADSKLVISHFTGSRGYGAALEFTDDLQGRLANRVQISADGLPHYVTAIPYAFDDKVDFGQIIKLFENTPVGKYSPPKCTGIRKKYVCGTPDKDLVSTSYIERQNLTIRMSCRRFTRLTNAFSKKVDNHKHALAIHFMHYNFCRIHKTLRVTPAMDAGIASHVWSLEELAELS